MFNGWILIYVEVFPMDRMHIKRLLTICLALMLSVSMLPAGTFALASEDGQDLAENGMEMTINNQDPSVEDADQDQQDTGDF